MTTLDQYNNDVSNTLQNLEYVINNGQSVYGGEDLKQKYNQVLHNESAAVTDYQNQKDLVMEDKIKNWKGLLKEKKNIMDAEKKILNKSKNNYINEFNENMIKLNELDKEISTKNQIIQMNQYNFEKKDLTVQAMQSAILYLVLMMVPLTLIFMGVIRPIVGYGAIFIFGLITLCVILIRFRRDGETDIGDIIKKSEKTSEELSRKFIKDIFPKSFVKECPKRCEPTPSEEEEEEPPVPPYDYNHGNEVWLDNSQNRWKQGDIPEIGATLKGWEKIEKGGQPKPYYGTNDGTPTYKCRWKYDPAKMTNMNKGLVFHTKIPCEFYPGYETIGKM